MKQKKTLPFEPMKEEAFYRSLEYQECLEEIKQRIRSSQHRATLAVNQELLVLYHEIGKQILQRQEKERWGAQVVTRLAVDLKKTFPTLRGFSRRNLSYMRAFAEAYPDRVFVQSVIAQIPWGHLIRILDKEKDRTRQLFYIYQTIELGFSQRVLTHHLETHLYERQGKALTNFSQTLLSPHAEAAQQILKDPYLLDFITLHPDATERQIEQSLIGSVEKFLLELGKGFAFVGRQYSIKVDREDYFIDLLFYHVKLHCYVVIELKNRPFQPEDAGKLNFYLTAMDRQVKDTVDKPSIGLLLCRGKNKLVAEYAFQDMSKPMGVSTFELKLLEELPKNMQDNLPTIEEIESELSL